MRTELISIATDTLPLDGAWHLPEDRPITGAVLLFHGNTMNFYVGAPRFLPPVLTRLGLACLAFNRRGHDILSIRDSRAAEGAAFQLNREGIADNRYAAAWLAERGFARPIVIGHSNGGMLAVKHVSDHPGTPAMVLLSAHGGGRGGMERTSRAGMLAGDRLEEVTAQARALVAAGRGRELMLVQGWWYALSAESFLDRMTEMPDALELAPTIRCPTLYIRGDEESADTYPAEAFRDRSGGPCDVEIVPDCNHFYVRREAAICDLVSSWLARTLTLQS
ncbi:MAG TPA: alpha/beta hydrolase [Stellaceae bacterium]|jgi:pimeloyl-ACP methyl ester carboxylesterase|nr:alpha/beta hydrolase [Stellaceae bacterium]